MCGSVIWTDHAIERAGERFGFDNRLIPNQLLLLKATRIEPGGNFQLQFGGVVYCCVRNGDDVIIKTVTRPNLHKRIARRSKKKYVRNKKWTEDS